MKTKIERKPIGARASLMLRVMHQEHGISAYRLTKRFPQFAERSVYRHAKKPLDDDPEDKRNHNKGRPRKLSLREERIVIRSLKQLRREECSFSAGKIHERAGLGHNVSHRCVRRTLRRHGFKYCQTRKKGLLTQKDMVLRLKYAKQNRGRSAEFWKKDIAFYFDGIGFVHKCNPAGEARTVSSMSWRLPKEGLTRTTKGRKEESGGKMANFFVAMSHTHGVVMCEHHEWKITGENFAQLVDSDFLKVFQKCNSPPGQRLFLQDGDPRQNSKKAKDMLTKLGYEMFAIPPRSPDLNPIENVSLVEKQSKSRGDKEEHNKRDLCAVCQQNKKGFYGDACCYHQQPD